MSDGEDSGVRVRTVLSAKELADDDTEVWLFRMPLDFDAATLAAAGIMAVDDGSADPGTVLHVYGGGVDGSGYELLVGDPSEGRPYRVLAQQEEEEDDEDDDEEEDDEDGPGPILRIPKAITRQFVVAQRAPTTPGRGGVSDSDGEEDASPASLPPPAVPLVVPYAPIAQVPNLRVRFLPAGAGTAPPPPLSDGEGPAKGPTNKDKDKGKDKRRRSEGEASSPDAEDGGKQKKKKKEKKR